MIEADPVAAFVREIMAARGTWAGRASDLLRAHIAAGEEVRVRTAGWPSSPRALASRLRRCQTFLRTVGIDIAFSRDATERISQAHDRRCQGLEDCNLFLRVDQRMCAGVESSIMAHQGAGFA